jgi:hypothetical protein
MGRASTSKKIAREARAAGPPPRSKRRFLWPIGLVAILAVGTLIILVARHDSHPAPATQIGTNSSSTTTLLTPSSGIPGASTPAGSTPAGSTPAGSTPAGSTPASSPPATTGAP